MTGVLKLCFLYHVDQRVSRFVKTNLDILDDQTEFGFITEFDIRTWNPTTLMGELHRLSREIARSNDFNACFLDENLMSCVDVQAFAMATWTSW